MTVTLCLFALVGFGLGLTVRWPILAIVAVIGLFGGTVILDLVGHGWLMALAWAVLMVVALEAGFMLGSFCINHNILKGFLGGSPVPAQDGYLVDVAPSNSELGIQPAPRQGHMTAGDESQS